MDLLWLLTSSKFQNFDKPTPSSLEYNTEQKDTRSAEQIRQNLLRKLSNLKESE